MKKISNSEFVVMDLLWKEGRSLNRHEIAELVRKNPKNEPWELPTISTFISRLCSKGVLTYEKKDRMYHYYPAVTKTEYIQTMINQKLEETFRISFDELVLEYTGNKKTKQNIKKVDEYIKNFSVD